MVVPTSTSVLNFYQVCSPTTQHIETTLLRSLIHTNFHKQRKNKRRMKNFIAYLGGTKPHQLRLGFFKV